MDNDNRREEAFERGSSCIGDGLDVFLEGRRSKARRGEENWPDGVIACH